MITVDLLKRDSFIQENLQKQDLIKRKDLEKIPTNERCVGLIGLRGVGKTTYLYQQRTQTKNSIYITCDYLPLRQNSLFDVIETLYKTYDIQTFFLDEIHYLADRDTHIKNCIDLLPINIVFSGSSMIDITSGGADLSRRVLLYTIPHFSYSEYISLTKNIDIPAYSLQDILDNHTQISLQNLEFQFKTKLQ